MAIYKGFIIDDEKQYKLKKIPVLICNSVGINRRKYPISVVEQAIEDYKKLCEADPTRKYIFAKHPKDDDEEWIGLLVGAIDDIYLDGHIVYADVTLFPTQWGYFIYWLLKNNYTIGTSIRGKIKYTTTNFNISEQESIPVKEASYLFLEGFDFVVFPSYIHTQVTKEHISEKSNLYVPYDLNDDALVINYYDKIIKNLNIDFVEKVKEQSSSEIITYDELKDKVKKDLYNINEKKDRRYKTMMGNNEREIIQAEVEKLKLEKTRYEIEAERIKEKVSQDKVKLSNLEEKIKEKEEEVKAQEIYLEKLLKMKKEYEDIKENYDKLVQEFEEKQKLIEELNKKLKENEELLEEIKEKRGELVMKCCGKEFSKDNPPKIRVVPIDEKVSKASWGDVNHTDTKKLVYLSGDKSVAKQVFGVVDGMSHWLQLKYPVYQHEKSEKEGYDIDMVLNYYGLKTALAFLLGRPGQKLSLEKRKHMAKWLLEKYTALKKAGIINNIPQTLLNLNKTLPIKEKININLKDELSKELFDLIFDNGLLEIEIEDTDENIKEKVEDIDIDINEDLLLSNTTIAISMALNGENLETIVEQMSNGKFQQINSFDDGIEVIWNLLNDSDVSQELELNTKDDFIKYVNDIINKLLGNEVVDGLTGINILQNALRGTGAVHIVIPMILFGIDKKIGGNEEENVAQNEQQPEENQNNVEQPVEQTQEKVKNKVIKVKENINKKDLKEDDMKKETFEALKNMLEESFDGIEIKDENELLPVIEKVVNDYSMLYNESESLERELLLKEAEVISLKKGFNVDEIKEKTESIDDIEKLKEFIEKLEKDDVDVENVKEKSDGKGYSYVFDGVKEKDKFDEILEDI